MPADGGGVVGGGSGSTSSGSTGVGFSPTPVKVGPEFLVNTTTAGAQNTPSITALTNGGFVVTWTDQSQSGADTSAGAVRAQVFDATGTKLGEAFLVNTTTAGTQDDQNITALTNGHFVVTWTDQSQSGADTSAGAVRAQVFDATGTKLGAEFLVNTTTVNRQSESSSTALTNGGFVVTWTDLSQDFWGDVRAQVFDATGAKLGAEFLVNTTTARSQQWSSITALTNGGFVVSWTDQSQSGADTSGSAVRAQVFDAIGAKLGAEFLVNTTIANWQYLPSITALTNGGFVVTWTDLSQSGADTLGLAVRAQIFDATGAKLGAEFLVNTTTANWQSDSSITALTNGSFVVTWTDESQSGADISIHAVRAQVFDATGMKLGAEFLVNTTTAGWQYDPSITALTNGDFVVTWTDESQSGGDVSGGAVRAQIFSVDGSTQNQAPDFTGRDEITSDRGQVVSFDLSQYFTDPDGDSLTFSASGLPTGLTLGANGVITGTITAPAGSNFNTALTASDGKGGTVNVFVDWAVVAKIPPTEAELELAAKYFAYTEFSEEEFPEEEFPDGPTEYGWTVSKEILNGTFRAVLLTSPEKESILAIRGTSPTATDWMQNSDPRSVGYLEAVSNKAELLALIAANPGIHIVGHSQGGAQAQLIAAWATDAGSTIGDVYTFNSPGIAEYDTFLFDESLAGDVKHFISSGDVVSMVGDEYLRGDVHFYDIIGIKNWFNPFSLIGTAHTGKNSALQFGVFPILQPATGYTIAGSLASTALSSDSFSFLSAAGKFDSEYFATFGGN